MSWQPPPPSFPQPYETTGSSNRRQNTAGDSSYLQAGPPPGPQSYPSQRHSPNVPPAQLYSSPQPSAPRGSTDLTTPTYGHASYSSPYAPAPSSGTVPHHPTYPVSAMPTSYTSTDYSGPPPPMMQRAVTMPVPVPSNTAPSMRYDSSPPNTMHSPSYSQMSGGPQSIGTSQSRNYREANEREEDSSDFYGGVPEQDPERKSNLQKRSPPSFPFAVGGRPHGRRPSKGSGSSSASPMSDQLPCGFCRKMSPREVVERLGGFCSERHRWQWAANQQG